MKKRCVRKKGISLILLVVTVVVMIILAGAVILNANKNDPINNAKIAMTKDEVDILKDKFNLQYGEMLSQANGDVNKIDLLELAKTIPPEYSSEFKATANGLMYVGNDEMVKEIARKEKILVSEPNFEIKNVDIATTKNTVYIKVELKKSQTQIQKYIYRIKKEGELNYTDYISDSKDFFKDDLQSGIKYYLILDIVDEKGTYLTTKEGEYTFTTN